MSQETVSQDTVQQPPAGGFETWLSYHANRLVMGIARHWLALFNLAWGTYVFLPFLAAFFMQIGLEGPARLIYAGYSFTCHQLPDHSYFLFGNNPTPHLHELEAAGMPAGLDLFGQRKYVGSDDFGWKVALCQRDIAIYASVLIAGLVFALVRDRVRPISIKLYAVLLIPIAVDGLSQMFGLRESNWWLRSITGAIFGAASVWLAYPYVESAMQDVLRTEEARQAEPPAAG